MFTSIFYMKNFIRFLQPPWRRHCIPVFQMKRLRPGSEVTLWRQSLPGPGCPGFPSALSSLSSLGGHPVSHTFCHQAYPCLMPGVTWANPLPLWALAVGLNPGQYWEALPWPGAQASCLHCCPPQTSVESLPSVSSLAGNGAVQKQPRKQ